MATNDASSATTPDTDSIPATLKVGKKRIPTLSITAILFTLLGLLLGLLTGYNLNRSTTAGPESSPVASVATSVPQEPWGTDEQQEAIGLASAVVTAYISDYSTPITWQDSMAVFGTERFKSWAAMADPSWVTSGHVTGIEETSYPNANTATITVITTVGKYPVNLIKDSEGTILVDEIVRR